MRDLLIDGKLEKGSVAEAGKRVSFSFFNWGEIPGTFYHREWSAISVIAKKQLVQLTSTSKQSCAVPQLGFFCWET